MKEKVVFVGAGGHCKILIESLDQDKYEIVGILDDFVPKGDVICGIPVVGCDDDAGDFFRAGVHHAVIAVVGNLAIRRKLLERYKNMGFSFPSVVHPAASVSSSARLGEGSVVLAGAIVNAEAILQDYVTVNTGAIVEHEVCLGENCHVAPGAVLLGASRVGHDTMIGAGSVVLQQKQVGSGCIVGAGSIVLEDIGDAKIVYGNPAKEKRQR